MMRTSLIRPADGCAIATFPFFRQAAVRPRPLQTETGAFPPPSLNRVALLLRRGLLRAGFRKIVIGGEGIRREVEALRGHHDRCIRALRVVHLLEEGALLAFLGDDGVP